MTNKNPDVEWLRNEVSGCTDEGLADSDEFILSFGRAKRILAHIDQLEADAGKHAAFIRTADAALEGRDRRILCLESELETLRAADQECAQQQAGPNVHEIAARIMAGMLTNPINNTATTAYFVKLAYDDAEALIAEGRRRDGNG